MEDHAMGSRNQFRAAAAVLVLPALCMVVADTAAARYLTAREWNEEYKIGNREYKFERKRTGEWKEEYKDGRCEVKRERTSGGEFKREIKCK
jgi:hypothetical protein